MLVYAKYKIKILSLPKGTSLYHSACLEPLCVTTGLNYEESYDEVREMAAILDAILNF